MSLDSSDQNLIIAGWEIEIKKKCYEWADQHRGSPKFLIVHPDLFRELVTYYNVKYNPYMAPFILTGLKVIEDVTASPGHFIVSG